ncbi:transcriptional regulator [Luteimonas aquatica]|uniref:transcriptional regulator n=1 Tax=Luteimonas aquatica TaxID=450364 RepID=UPI001F56CB77|nr:transcriptional regulator [Luteimonas aquatica]
MKAANGLEDALAALTTRLDPALEHRARLGIAVLLARHGEISFARFKEQLEMSDGNLGAQLRRLENEGYVSLRRDFVERKPVTWYQLTATGRKALTRHLRALQDVIAQASK